MPIGTGDLTQEEINEFKAMGVDLGELATPPAEEENAGVSQDDAAAPTDTEVPGQPGAEEQQDQTPVEGDQSQAPPEGQEDKRTVPYQALTQARALLSQARERETAANQRVALATARMNALLATQREREREAVPELPDLNTDPEGHINGMRERLEAFENQRAQEREDQELSAAIQADERDFMAVQPDLEEASTHYVTSRGQELLLMHTPQEVQAIMNREVKQMARLAWSRGMSFGEMLYNTAKARGYVKAAPAAPTPRPGAPAPAARTAAPTPAAVLQAQRQGKAASRSLSTGAAAPASELNAQALLELSDEEFEAAMGIGTKQADKNFAKVFEQ